MDATIAAISTAMSASGIGTVSYTHLFRRFGFLNFSDRNLHCLCIINIIEEIHSFQQTKMCIRDKITSVPAPLMLAPMLFRKFATSTTCGSLAAFSMIVRPDAIDAAIMILIVAPTETTSRKI